MYDVSRQDVEAGKGGLTGKQQEPTSQNVFWHLTRSGGKMTVIIMMITIIVYFLKVCGCEM